MGNDTYNALRVAIAGVERSLAELKDMLNMTTDESGLDEGVPVNPDAAPAPADQFAKPALAGSAPASAPTVEVVDEAEVPDEVKAQDQGS